MLDRAVDRLIEALTPKWDSNRRADKAGVKQGKDRMPPSNRRQIFPSSRRSCRILDSYRIPDHEAVPQTCSLLAKLPLELRLQIYQYAIGDSTIHVVEFKQRLAHVECSSRLDVDIERACIPHRYKNERPDWSDDIPDWKFDTLLGARLALLQTCRQIYAESIDILYSTNTFDFATAETFNLFVRTIPPTRLTTIRSLSIRLFNDAGRTIVRTPRDDPHIPEFNYNLAQGWDPMWQIIKHKMNALKRLHVVLFGHEFDHPGLQKMVVRPIEGLKGLGVFELEIRKGVRISGTVFDYTLVQLLPSTQIIVNQALSSRSA
jgi:hypothetical protein